MCVIFFISIIHNIVMYLWKCICSIYFYDITVIYFFEFITETRLIIIDLSVSNYSRLNKLPKSAVIFFFCHSFYDNT
jgi:hypothetical protein